MSNYTTENLVPVLNPENRVPAIRIGDQVFVMQSGGGSATDFYKCATVDTVNQTWTGYKAVLSGGVYSFESTATSGLTYGTAFTPLVDKIYDDGALVKVDKLYIGLDPTMVFYAPLAESSAAAVTGQVFTQTGTVAYTTEDGIPCAYFNGNARLSFEMESLLSTLSISAWLKYSNNSITPVVLGSPGSSHHTASIYSVNSQVGWSSWADDKTYPCSSGVWHHIALCANSSDRSVNVYIDGTLAGTSYHTWELQQKNGWLGGNTQGYALNGYLAAVRIYDRLLTSSEVAALAAEFTPSAS